MSVDLIWSEEILSSFVSCILAFLLFFVQVTPAAKGFSHAPIDAAFLQPIYATKPTTAATTRTRSGVLVQTGSSNVTEQEAVSLNHCSAMDSTTVGICRTRQDAATRPALRDSSSASLLDGAYLRSTRVTDFGPVRMDLMRALALAPTVSLLQLAVEEFEKNASKLCTR